MLWNAQYDASSYLEQFPQNQMWQWELREGGIPGLVTGREGGRPHVQRQDQVLLHVLQDQVVAHNLDVGDDLVDQALDVARRSTLEIETGYDRNISLKNFYNTCSSCFFLAFLFSSPAALLLATLLASSLLATELKKLSQTIFHLARVISASKNQIKSPCSISRQLEDTLDRVDRQNDWLRVQPGPRHVDLRRYL